MLASLQLSLRDPVFLRKLLHTNKKSPVFPKEFPEIQWQIIPPYYPVLIPRCSFKLLTPYGNYLLKLNADTGCIRREAGANNILSDKHVNALTVPNLIDSETSLPLPENESCGWLLREWVEAKQVSGLDEHLLINLFAKGLIHLHTMPISAEDVQTIFALELPEKPVVLEYLKRRRNSYFDDLIEVSSASFSSLVSTIKADVENHDFSSHVALIHGDLHLDNIRYLENVAKHEIRLLWVDWEDVTLEHPLSDLANFMLYEKFSITSFRYMNTYIKLFNKRKVTNDRLSATDAWFLAYTWLVRVFCWKLQMAPSGEHDTIEDEAIILIKKIQEAIKEYGELNAF